MSALPVESDALDPRDPHARALDPASDEASQPVVPEPADVEPYLAGVAGTQQPPTRTRRTRRQSPGQLPLELRVDLPRLEIEPEWKDQQRLWGHSFHPMCSYLASYPAGLAHAFIARYTRPGDVVLDPFSGRGTTPLQACAEGRVGVGLDLNPFAHLLTAAKVDAPGKAETRMRLTTLRIAWGATSAEWLALAERVVAAPGSSEVRVPSPSPRSAAPAAPLPVPAEVAVAFHPTTLAQLLFLRSQLDREDRVDRFLLAAITGILHGKSASYLSPVMPNTFSMAPRYVREFVARTRFEAPQRDAFGCLDAKLKRLYRQPVPATRGIALLGDARDSGVLFRHALRTRGLPERARLAVASPPYLRVVKYGYYNWLRLWFLGYDAGAIDDLLDDAHHRDAYLIFMREVLRGLRPALADDGIVALVIGDVELDRGRPIDGGVGLAEAVWELAAAPEGYRLAGVTLDDVAAGRKMTKLWGEQAGQATKTDRILVLSTSEIGRRRAITGARLPIDWAWPPASRSVR